MNNPDNRPAEPGRGDSNEPEPVDGGVSLPEQPAEPAPAQFSQTAPGVGQAPDVVQQPGFGQHSETQQYPDFPQHYAGEQYPGQQQFGAQQYPGQQFGAEQYPAQQYPDYTGQYPGAQYPGAQYPEAPYAEQQYPESQYPGTQYPETQYPDQRSAEPQYAEFPQQYAGTEPTGQAPTVTTSRGLPAPTRTRRPRVDANGVPYGVGRFSVREVVILILAALVLIASFLPFIGGTYAALFGYTSLWAPAPWLAIPGALLLAAAATLLVIRRLRPDLNLRVGSLSVDQFASVAAVSTAGFYVGALFLLLGISAWFDSDSFGGLAFGGSFDVFQPGAGLILGLIFSVATVVPTVCARFIRVFAEDFSARSEIPAHPAARDAVAVPVRPRQARTPRPHAGPQPEVHQYGDEHSGSIQLTPADTRPEDVGAYRRRGWSPDSSTVTADTDTDTAVDVTGLAEAPSILEPVTVEAGTGEAGPGVSEPLERGGVEPTGVGRGNAADPDDEIDEFHTGEEPAPVSALRHVAEQESLAEEADAVLPQAIDDDERSAGRLDESGTDQARSVADVAPGAQAVATPAVISTQPFWVYSRVPLPVVDEKTGDTVFEIGPGAWALAIVDRGSELVIRHDDGRVGVLRRLSGVMRG